MLPVPGSIQSRELRAPTTAPNCDLACGNLTESRGRGASARKRKDTHSAVGPRTQDRPQAAIRKTRHGVALGNKDLLQYFSTTQVHSWELTGTGGEIVRGGKSYSAKDLRRKVVRHQ